MDSLGDATVVITGASSGIGLATARAFAARGANVVLAARRRALLDRAVQGCEELGARALAVPTDVTDPDQVRELADAAINAFGGIDVWVNNAGTSMWGRFEEIPLESQSRLVELNLLGAMNGSHAVLPHFFERRGRGVIVNVSSIFGRVQMPFAASYTASKAGLAGFTEALRAELAPRSEIEVCCVYPAYVDTPTYLNSANYTGRALRPVLPVVPPERVAERIVGLALHPRRSARVGALNAARSTRSPSRTRSRPMRPGGWCPGWAGATCSVWDPRNGTPTAAFSGRLREGRRPEVIGGCPNAGGRGKLLPSPPSRPGRRACSSHAAPAAPWGQTHVRHAKLG